MKFVICIAILIVAPTLGQAQGPETANKPQTSVTSAQNGKQQPLNLENQQLLAAALLHSYATSVNRLLNELANRLQAISQHAAAGEVSQQNALVLKLAATRDTIARLETISAVYDSQLLSNDDEDPDLNTAGDANSSNRALSMLRPKSTVAVEELQRESGK